jgi:hypothetical protein
METVGSRLWLDITAYMYVSYLRTARTGLNVTTLATY